MNKKSELAYVVAAMILSFGFIVLSIVFILREL